MKKILFYTSEYGRAQAIWDDVSAVNKETPLPVHVLDDALYEAQEACAILIELNEANNLIDAFEKANEVAVKFSLDKKYRLLRAELDGDSIHAGEYLNYYCKKYSDDVKGLKKFIKEEFPYLTEKLRVILTFS